MSRLLLTLCSMAFIPPVHLLSLMLLWRRPKCAATLSSCWAWQKRGFLPAALAKRSRYGTPTLAIILSSLGILMLVTFDFLQVLCAPCSSVHGDVACGADSDPTAAAM